VDNFFLQTETNSKENVKKNYFMNVEIATNSEAAKLG
jgi:hypothetical protein